MSVTSRTKLTPPELAKRWGIDPAKVLAWVKSGELRAVNLATDPHGRPRWAIDEADVLVFENRRTAQPPTPTPRRRRRAADGVIEFFK